MDLMEKLKTEKGITVIMVTGDQAVTARSIAEAVPLTNTGSGMGPTVPLFIMMRPSWKR